METTDQLNNSCNPFGQSFMLRDCYGRLSKNIKVLFIITSIISIVLSGCGGGPWGVIETQRRIEIPTWSPDGENIAFVMDVRLFRRGSKIFNFWSGSYDDIDTKIAMSYIIKMNIQTKAIDILIKKEMGDYYSGVFSGPLWRGGRIFFIESGEMDVMDVNDKNIKRNILANVYYYRGTYSNESNFRISHSGDYIVYWGATYPSNNSWSVINWDGTNNRVLINKGDIAPTGEAYLLGWSKTEDKIYFSTRMTSSSTNEIYYEIGPLGSIKQIPNAPEYESEYEDENVSPDQTKIVYEYCKYPSIYSNLFITKHISGEDPSGGEDITSQITNKELGLAE